MNGEKGVLLMEALPAFMLVLLALLIIGRVIGLQGKWQQQLRIAGQSGSALAAVCIEWDKHGGRAAIVSRQRQTAAWTVVTLPGPTWLPVNGTQFMEQFGADCEVSFWRRLEGTVGNSEGWWIEQADPVESSRWHRRGWRGKNGQMHGRIMD